MPRGRRDIGRWHGQYRRVVDGGGHIDMEFGVVGAGEGLAVVSDYQEVVGGARRSRDERGLCQLRRGHRIRRPGRHHCAIDHEVAAIGGWGVIEEIISQSVAIEVSCAEQAGGRNRLPRGRRDIGRWHGQHRRVVGDER